MFLVENPHNDAPTCFECSSVQYAMLCKPNYGPTFGNHALVLHQNGDTSQSYTNLPQSYTDTLGRGQATFTGAQIFTPEDYEVWAVN